MHRAELRALPRLRRTGAALLLGLTLSAAQAACTLGTPVTSGPGTYAATQDSVQAIDVPLSCAVTDAPVLTFSSAGGSFDSGTQRYISSANATNGDRLTYYIPNAYNSRLDPTRTSFRFQVIYPQGQWNASSSTYTDTLTITVTF